MKKDDFDIASYSDIMEKYFDNTELTEKEIEELHNYYYVKKFYKTISNYTKFVLGYYPFYDDENDFYYYIVLYNGNYYKVCRNVLDDEYIKERIDEIPVLKEEYETITDLNELINYEQTKKQNIKRCRKRFF